MSLKEGVKSVDMMSVFLPFMAWCSAVAAAEVVLPTPPLPQNIVTFLELMPVMLTATRNAASYVNTRTASVPFEIQGFNAFPQFCLDHGHGPGKGGITG